MWRRVGEGCGVESRTGAAARGRAAPPAAHLAAPVGPQHAAFLLTHHLHAAPIVFKCLHLNRATFQNTLPSTDFHDCPAICLRSPPKKIGNNQMSALDSKSLQLTVTTEPQMWILSSARIFALLAVLNLFLEAVYFLLVQAGSGSRKIMLQCCDKRVVICLARGPQLSCNLTITSTMQMITGRATDTHKQIIV